MDYTRRDFLSTITAATLGAAGLTLSPVSTQTKFQSDGKYAAIPEGGTVLFQGDSITDGGRNRKQAAANTGLGNGYAFLAAAQLRDELAARNLQIYNRGISGNKVFQLADRWPKDCLQFSPDLLSILIGVNDFWHTLNNYDGTVEVYRRDFESLLQRTKRQLPDAQLIVGEPFVVKEGSAITDDWFPVFKEYQHAARELASEFNAAFIPYQSIFNEAAKRSGSPTYWTNDGVHPTLAGSHLMAQAWLETAKRM